MSDGRSRITDNQRAARAAAGRRQVAANRATCGLNMGTCRCDECEAKRRAKDWDLIMRTAAEMGVEVSRSGPRGPETREEFERRMHVNARERARAARTPFRSKGETNG